jgi:hypothetical protein
MGTKGGIIEIHQSQVRHALTVARMGIQQANQMALDGIHHMGHFPHALPRGLGSLFQSLEQTAARSLNTIRTGVPEHGLVLVQTADE